MLPVHIAEIGDWRLSDGDFMLSFALTGSTCDALAKEHPHARDSRIVFEAQAHTYYVDGIPCPHSVTALLHNFAEEFVPAAVVRSMQSRSDWPAKSMSYRKEDGSVMQEDEIITAWAKNGQVQRARGHLLHYHAEQYLNGRDIDLPHSPEFQQVKLASAKFFNEGWYPFRTEFAMFHERTRLAGQADLLCRDAEGNIILVDWKRIRELKYSNPYRNLKPPLAHLPDCNYSLYCLQLNLYARILETEYGFCVTRMILAIVHPTKELPELIDCPKMFAEIDDLLAHAASQASQSK